MTPGDRGREEKAVCARGSSHPAILGPRAVLAFQAGLGARLSPGRERALRVPSPAFGLPALRPLSAGRSHRAGRQSRGFGMFLVPGASLEGGRDALNAALMREVYAEQQGMRTLERRSGLALCKLSRVRQGSG